MFPFVAAPPVAEAGEEPVPEALAVESEDEPEPEVAVAEAKVETAVVVLITEVLVQEQEESKEEVVKTTVVFWVEAEPVAEADLEAEAETMETVLPAAEQVLAYAFKAACVAPPHSFWIWCWTLVESAPQSLSRSAGLGSVETAARRHAGGTATTSLAEKERRASRTVDVVKRILKAWNVYSTWVFGVFRIKLDFGKRACPNEERNQKATEEKDRDKE